MGLSTRAGPRPGRGWGCFPWQFVYNDISYACTIRYTIYYMFIVYDITSAMECKMLRCCLANIM